MILKNILVRSLAFALVLVAAVLVVRLSGTTDPLGAGLAIFLVCAVISLVWGFFDGRGAARPALVVWLVTAVVLGVVFTVGTAIVDDAVTLDAAELGTDVLLGLFLVYPAALVGIGIGALTSRGRN